MPTTTANLGLTLPTPNVDTGWGSTLNTDFTLIDNLFVAGGTGTSVGLNVGSGKTLGISGTLLLGSGDGTGTTVAPTIRGAARTGTNVVGANLTIDAANGTGTGGSGAFVFRTAPAGSSGTIANTFQNSLVIDSAGNVGVLGNISVSKPSGFAQQTVTAGAVSTFVQANSGGLGASGTSSNHEYVLYTNSIERLRVGTAGQIGISGANYGSAGQVLTSNGSGSSVSWSNPVTTSSVLSATAGGTTAAVGTYAFLRFEALTAASAGTNHAGSGLRYSNGNGGGTGVLVGGGTWKLMGETGVGSNAASASLFLRIA